MDYYTFTDELSSQILKMAQPSVVEAAPTATWPMHRLGDALLTVIAYLAFVFVGSAIMKNQESLSTKLYPLRFGYNVIQMVLCSYMSLEAMLLAYRHGYSVVCNSFVHGAGAPIANLLWMFYMSKILDFMDTVFIVLGKKWAQLSFLHVYHHTTIFLFYWLNLHVNYDGDIYLTIVLNGLIHALMYTYYFVSLHTNNIWWKSSLTMGQMIQFCCMITQALILLGSGCGGAPPRVTAVYVVYIFSLLVLFLQFYLASYGKKAKKEAKSIDGKKGK